MSFPLNFEELKRSVLSHEGAYFAMARLIERGFWFSADYVQQSSRFLIDQNLPFIASRIIFKAADHYWELYQQEVENRKFYQKKHHAMPPESSTLTDAFTQAENFYEQGVKVLTENFFCNESARAVEKLASVYDVLAKEQIKMYQLIDGGSAFEKLEKLPLSARQQKIFKQDSYQQAKMFLEKSIAHYEKSQTLYWQGGMHADALRITMLSTTLKIEAQKFLKGIPKAIKYCIKMGFLSEASQLYQSVKNEVQAKKWQAKHEDRRRKIMEKKQQADETLSAFHIAMKNTKAEFARQDKQLQKIENPGFFTRIRVYFMKRKLKQLEKNYLKIQQRLKKSAQGQVEIYFQAKELGKLQELSYAMEWHDKTFESIALNMESHYWSNNIVHLFSEIEKLKEFKQEIIQKQIKNLLPVTEKYLKTFNDLISVYKEGEKLEMSIATSTDKHKADKFKKAAKLYESSGWFLPALQCVDQFQDTSLKGLYSSLFQLNAPSG